MMTDKELAELQESLHIRDEKVARDTQRLMRVKSVLRELPTGDFEILNIVRINQHSDGQQVVVW